MDWNNLVWLVVIFSTAILPMLRRMMLNRSRQRLIAQMQKRRGTRVITLIHRQETMSLLGLPIYRYIDIEDSERVLREVRETPVEMPIDLIMHTPGGLVLAAEQIALALRRHRAPVTVMVPHYAMSGGTLIALATDQIAIDPNAVLGPVDPQLGEYPAASLLRLKELKSPEATADATLVMIDLAAKAMNQVREFVLSLLKEKLAHDQAEALTDVLTDGRYTHDYPITEGQLREFGLPVTNDVPAEVYQLMALYQAGSDRRPSIIRVPNVGNDKPAVPR